MADNEFEVNGVKYKASKINAMKQFHIVRRLAPIMADLVPIAQKFQKMGEAELKEDQTEAIAPILNGIGKLSDKDAEIVLYGLLAGAEMKQNEHGNWARISDGTNLFFQDIPLPTLLQVAAKVFQHNLTGFFGVLPQVSR